MSEQTELELIDELERMRERELRYRVLLDDSSDPIFSFNREGQYLYVNRQFAAGLEGEITPDEIIGKTIWDVFDKDEADMRFAVVKGVFEHKERRDVEVRVPLADEDNYYLTSVKPIFDETGEVEYIICISKNITERKRYEAELHKRAEELERALNEIRELKGIVPICSYCKKTRNDEGYWHEVENYISTHTGAKLSHGICPDCLPGVYKEAGMKPPDKR